MPGAGSYEFAILLAATSLILQYMFNRRGNKEAVILCRGITMLGLGVVFVEAVMHMLKLLGSILQV